jgi:hypothetical protein
MDEAYKVNGITKYYNAHCAGIEFRISYLLCDKGV